MCFRFIATVLGLSATCCLFSCASGRVNGSELAALEDGQTTGSTTSAEVSSLYGAGDLVIVGHGYPNALDANVYIAVTDLDSQKKINDVTTAYAIDPNGALQVSFSKLLTADAHYEVAIFVDTNGNGFCNAPPIDTSYIVRFTALSSASVVAIDNTDDTIAACSRFGTFDFVFDSQGGLSEGHPGHMVYGVLNDASDNTLVGELKGDLVASKPNTGQASLTWPTTLVPGHKYHFAICVDDNQNGRCDANAGTDHQFYWLEDGNSTNGVASHLSETFVLHHETNQLITQYWPTTTGSLPPVLYDIPTIVPTSDVIAQVNVDTHPESKRYTAIFDGNSALYEHDDLYCYAAVIDMTDPNNWVRVGEPKKQMVTDGNLRLEWPNILQKGHIYSIAAFSDIKGDAICLGTAGAEPQWLIPLPFTRSDATAYFTHQGRKASCQYFPAGPLP